MSFAGDCDMSAFLYRERFNLAGAHRDLLDAPAALAGPAAPALGGPFGVDWRNYMKYVFQNGFMYIM